MQLEEYKITDYLDDLAAAKSTPGGGCAAALTSAQGAALLSMVCNFTKGEKYQHVESEVESILRKCESSREMMTNLASEDKIVFSKVMAAYKLPKETESQKKMRINEIQVCLIDCAQVPFELLVESSKLFEVALQLKDIGNKNLLSDVLVGAHLLYAGILSAKENVEINLSSINDKEFCESKRLEMNNLIEMSLSIYQRISS